MITKLLSGLLGKVIKSKIVSNAIAGAVDHAVKRELDKKTGGLASKVDEVL